MKAAGKSKPDGRKDILDAAAVAFMEYGYAGTSIDMVADVLGATKGKIYYHFKNKTDLFLDVHRETMSAYIEAVEEVAKGPGTPLDKLRGVLMTLALQVMNRLPYAKVAVQGLDMHMSRSTTPQQRGVLREIIDMRDRGENLLVEIIEDGIARGLLRPCLPRLIVKPMLGALNWMTVWYRQRPDDTPEARQALAEALVDYLLNGIVAPTV
ncbi:TetR family transcriptional regulator [Pinisolibacter aquiterrae]|uniref:TetR family transcriptional regulator n=1 Tax=Pinisolibacter aquiterrae TaxID=2815579 RepID=UPI001C3E85AC|nr:TetR family transcriptional regulator [Pinisolibacter aquiterrae]MBV5266877.1 TetR family transcriptional regulator [Pinisolibacter aquiterrae]MCC8234812.1 TetR family transcriptional regulator [Pinisolibacter aquiterrae]